MFTSISVILARKGITSLLFINSIDVIHSLGCYLFGIKAVFIKGLATIIN